MFPKSLVLIFAGLAAMPFAAGASVPTDVRSVHVHFSDLDLAHDAGVERLYVRLQRAATSVCDLGSEVRDLHAITLQEACVKRALDRAVADVRSARLSARHALGAAPRSVAMRD